MSIINTKVKSFNNIAFKNNDFINITEKDITGKWNIFFFYPADFTFVCPTELGDMSNNYKLFQEIGVDIYAISTDTHFTHKAWYNSSKTIKNIEYAMIGDPTGHLARNFEIIDEKTGLANRGTFIINQESIIQSIEIVNDNIGRDSSELLRKVKALQYVASHPGEVCPAKWKEGNATITVSTNLIGNI
ncbi:MAG: peroxiredoxin [Pantoea sp. Brub]|nr:peroxiredoxin [Pantoea sp. Brub]